MSFMDTKTHQTYLEVLNLNEIKVIDTEVPEVKEESDNYQYLVAAECLGIAILTYVLFAMKKSDTR